MEYTVNKTVIIVHRENSLTNRSIWKEQTYE